MKRSHYFILSALFALNLTYAYALEIDEKLTLRFLKVSSTQKTVLINRGGEDGLVVGDHAKFFITAGVVARGVSEKVSPSRSVWSLYRIVDPTEIVQDKVLNLKIASPVKITEDPSKSLKEEAIPGGEEKLSISSDDSISSSNDVGNVESDADNDELRSLGNVSESNVKPTSRGGRQASVVANDIPVYPTSSSKSWEVWGTTYFNSLSGTKESDAENSEATSVAASSFDFSAGIEKYFVNYNNFFKELSLTLFLHKNSVESGGEIKSKTDYMEFGVGANYHFYNSAASVNRLIGHGAVSFGKGTPTLESKLVSGDSSVEGSNTFFSGGVGIKYVLSNGFGMRGIIDYYSSSESFEYDSTTDTRTLSGPRIQFGLSYRF